MKLVVDPRYLTSCQSRKAVCPLQGGTLADLRVGRRTTWGSRVLATAFMMVGITHLYGPQVELFRMQLAYKQS